MLPFRVELDDEIELKPVTLSDEQNSFLDLIVIEIRNELLKNLSSYSAINKSIRDFNLIHTGEKVLDLESCKKKGHDFFDETGKWNKQAEKIDENLLVIDDQGNEDYPLYDLMQNRVNEILYPNILSKNEVLSDKERIILCALIYSIQTKISEKYLPDMRTCKTVESVRRVQDLQEIIYKAVNVAAASCISEIKPKILEAELKANRSFARKFSQFTLGFLTPNNNGNVEREPFVELSEANDVNKCTCFGML